MIHTERAYNTDCPNVEDVYGGVTIRSFPWQVLPRILYNHEGKDWFLKEKVSTGMADGQGDRHDKCRSRVSSILSTSPQRR